MLHRVGFCPSKTGFGQGSGQNLVLTGQNWTKPNGNCKSLQWVRNSLRWKESEDNEWIFLLTPVYYYNYILYSIYHGSHEQHLDKTWTKLGLNFDITVNL